MTDRLPDTQSIQHCREALTEALASLPEGATNVNRLFTVSVLAAELLGASPNDVAAAMAHAIRDLTNVEQGQPAMPECALALSSADMGIAAEACSLFASIVRTQGNDPAYVEACESLADRLRMAAEAVQPSLDASKPPDPVN